MALLTSSHGSEEQQPGKPCAEPAESQDGASMDAQAFTKKGLPFVVCVCEKLSSVKATGIWGFLVITTQPNLATT